MASLPEIPLTLPATGGVTAQTIGFGIDAYGEDIRLIENDVSLTHSTGPGWGIGTSHRGSSGIIKHNRITGVTGADPTKTAGIKMDDSATTALIADNEIVNGGQFCIFYDSSSTGIYRNNAISGCVSNYSGGINGGGNFPPPPP